MPWSATTHISRRGLFVGRANLHNVFSRLDRFSPRQGRLQSTASSTTANPLPPPRSLLRRVLPTAILMVTCLFAGGVIVLAPYGHILKALRNPPSDAETLSLFIPSTPTTQQIDDHLTNHPLARRLRSQPDITESRPHLKIPESLRAHSLTSGPLMGPRCLEVPPISFAARDQPLPTLTQLIYVGPALAGHPGVAHGGLLATLLDEGLARACFPALPHQVGVTANLRMDYRAPCPVDAYVLLRAETTRVEGRKAWVRGWIEVLGEEGGQGTKLVEAEALFVEPRNVKHMQRIYGRQAGK